LFEAYFETLIRFNPATENDPELTRLTTGFSKKMFTHHSRWTFYRIETLKLKYETKPPKLSSHGEEDELAV